MSAVFQFFTDVPLMYLFLVVGLGAALGHIPFGKVRLGAAMVLFIALGITAAGCRRRYLRQRGSPARQGHLVGMTYVS